MKKLFNISFVLLMLALSACAPSEVDDLFDKSAAERLNDAIDNYTDYFKKDGGKWEMLYFANSGEPGYLYVVTFSDDGSVKMTGTVKGDSYGNISTVAPFSEESLWEVIADNGPVLSFCTFNNAFHYFCSPTSDGQGHEGDFEFMIMKTENDRAVLKGKKRGITLIMNRLDSSIDDVAYLNSATAALNAFPSTIPYIIMTTGSGLKYICQGQQDMYWYFYPETGNEIDNLEAMNAIITPNAIRFMNPLDFMTDYEPNQKPVQNFVLQDDGSYLCVEDGVTRITAPPFAYVFMQFNTTRDIVKESVPVQMTGAFEDVCQRMIDQSENTTSVKKLKSIQIMYNSDLSDEENNQYVYDLILKSNRLNKSTGMRMNISMVDDNTVKFNFDDKDANAFEGNNAKSFYKLSTVQEFIALLCQCEYTIEAESVLNPNPMVLRSTTNENDSFAVTF